MSAAGSARPARPPRRSVPCPPRRYYSGEKKAPVLTVFIGGNHEASNHLQELPYGGWVAPNIYYLGTCGFSPPPGAVPVPGRDVLLLSAPLRRLRGRGAVPRSEDRRHFGHLQVARLPERYGRSEGRPERGSVPLSFTCACLRGAGDRVTNDTGGQQMGSSVCLTAKCVAECICSCPGMLLQRGFGGGFQAAKNKVVFWNT